ncbi:hypothetical protein AGMMS49545_21520 [Betaproteobacteria bacterium]|nr:hypothetical protein AGMMS49545_21520 [Betaproteobacteria bacterium]GHU40107.1 hypothetical protein AGMMS50289_01170 [Betaproteobacteria bacterium]
MNRGCCLLLCTLAAPGICAAQPLGRLFYTAAERAQLENAQPEAPVAAKAPRYQGFIESSSGRRTILLEGQAGQNTANEADPNTIGGTQDELLRGGHITVHPEK